MGQTKKENPLKSAGVVMGALAFGWLAFELAFKPLLDKARNAMDKSDPACDPDNVAGNDEEPTEEIVIGDELPKALESSPSNSN